MPPVKVGACSRGAEEAVGLSVSGERDAVLGEAAPFSFGDRGAKLIVLKGRERLSFEFFRRATDSEIQQQRISSAEAGGARTPACLKKV